jgi:hypothetical protein
MLGIAGLPIAASARNNGPHSDARELGPARSLITGPGKRAIT